MTIPFEQDAGLASHEALEAALTKEYQAGRLAPHHIVPAVYGIWVGSTAQRMEQDHIHLPEGTSLDYTAVFEPETHRLDMLLSCPTLMQQLATLSLTGIITVLYLN